MRLERCDGISGGLGQRICRTLRLGAALARSVAEVLDGLGVSLGDWLCDCESIGDGLGGALDFGAALAGAVAEMLDRLCEVSVSK